MTTEYEPKPSRLARLLACLEDAIELDVQDDESASKGRNILLDLNNVKKELEDERKTLKAPLLKETRKIDAGFKPYVDQAQRGIATVKTELAEYADKIRRQQIAAEEARAAEAAKTEDEDGRTAAFDTTIEAPQAAPVSMRTVREVVIVDEGIIPREFLVPDMVKIRKHALEGTQIPGVEVRERKDVVAR